MSLRIYNTRTGCKDEFSPREPGHASMYVCGVTVYNLCHIGHGRAAVVFDVVYRTLKHFGLTVTYVRNFTDVDDKIIHKANAEGVSSEVIADRYVEATLEDMSALGCLQPTHQPRVTTHIAEIIDLVGRLVAAGRAYESGGDVYFSVSSYPPYGNFSQRNLEDLRAGARVEVNDLKRNPLDFALWKASKPGEPYWESPWGRGRPGWHIECSAMGMRYLGESFDIHGGGADLIFPHHENEVAQSEAVTGKPFARYWMHNGMITVASEKMAKSLGNFVTIRDALVRFHRETIRLFLLSTHYRSPVDFSDSSLEEAEAGLERLYQAVSRATQFLELDKGQGASLVRESLKSAAPEVLLRGTWNKSGTPWESPPMALTPPEKELHSLLSTVKIQFVESLEDDFNTARAVGHLFELARGMGRFVTEHKKATPHSASLLGASLTVLLGYARDVLGILGLEPETFQSDLNSRRLPGRSITETQIVERLTARTEARKQKNWAQADAIREELAASGILIEDTPAGTRWRVLSRVAPSQS